MAYCYLLPFLRGSDFITFLSCFKRLFIIFSNVSHPCITVKILQKDLSLTEDRGQTDHITTPTRAGQTAAAAALGSTVQQTLTLDLDLDLQSQASYGRDPCTRNKSRSKVSRVER